jgi:hypothetical protein
MRFFSITSLLFLSVSCFSQPGSHSYPYAFEKKDLIVWTGLSVAHWQGNTYPNCTKIGGFPAINLAVHYGLSDFISIGPLMSFYSRVFKYYTNTDSYIFHANRYFFGGTIAFHFAPWIEDHISQSLDSEHFDLYATLGGGYKNTIFLKERLFDDKGEGAIVAYGGMKYYFGSHLGLFAEAGYMPFAAAAFGVCGRF